ncbi:MAG: DinB family protein [Candidatus Heimdallarchaeota archaeon]
MTLKEFISTMKRERNRWNLLIKTLIDNGYANEIIKDKWTLKDVIAHIYWYEFEIVNALRQKSIKNIKFWNESIRKRNSFIFSQTNGLSLEKILVEANKTFTNLIIEIEKLSNDDLKSRSFFKDSRKTVFRLIMGNSTDHYREHDYKLIKRFNLSKSGFDNR